MIRAIEDMLNEDVVPEYVDVTLYDVANSVLNIVERMGMSPPPVNDPVLFTEERKWERE
jgi:hypothetical protein